MKKELKKQFKKEIKADRRFIIAAVSFGLFEHIEENHEDWLDSGGLQPYYDLVVELTEYMLFSKGSMYIKYLKERQTRDVGFTEVADNCLDWFHMDLAKKLVTEELLHEICFGKPKEYFKRITAQKEL